MKEYYGKTCDSFLLEVKEREKGKRGDRIWDHLV